MIHIQKEVETKHGVIANCWRVEDLKFNSLPSSQYYICEGNLKLYLNETCAFEGKELLDNCTFEFNDLTETDIYNNPLGVIYSKILQSTLTAKIGEVDFTTGIIAGV